MSENDFQPHSDEELARLLEEQMKALRPSTSTSIPEPQDAISSPEPADTNDTALDELFGALLDDSPSPTPPDTPETLVERPTIDESALGLTQPIEHVSPPIDAEDALSVEREQDIMSAAVITESQESDIEDVHVVAERVLHEIDTQGVVVATTIAATASPEPIPEMFGGGAIEVNEMVVDSPAAISALSGPPQQDLAAEFVRRVSRDESGFTARPRFDDLVFGQDS
jgi:hypothetical protein